MKTKIIAQSFLMTLIGVSTYAAPTKIWSCSASCIFVDEARNQLFQMVNSKSVDGSFIGKSFDRSQAFSKLRGECLEEARAQNLNGQKVYLTTGVSAERSDSHSTSKSSHLSEGRGTSLILLGRYSNSEAGFSNSQSDSQSFKYNLAPVDERGDCNESDYDPTQAPAHVGFSEVKG